MTLESIPDTTQIVAAAFHGSPVGMAVTDPQDGRFLVVNAALCDILGRDAAALIGTRYDEVLHPADRPADTDLRLRLVSGAATVAEAEQRCIRPDGALRRLRVVFSLAPIDPHGVLYVDQASRARCLLLHVEDVTDRRRAEETFRDLVESAPDAMVIVDGDGRISIVNAQTERLFGWSRDDLVGRTVEVLVPDASRQDHVRHREGYASEPRHRPMGAGLELHGRRRDGTVFPVEISLSPITTPRGRLFSAAIRDITDRQRAERRVRESEAHKTAILASMADGVVITDSDGTIVAVNRALEQLTGWAEAELVGRPFTVLVVRDDEGKDIAAPERLLARALASRGTVATRGYREHLLTRDGRLVPVAGEAAPVFDAQGRMLGAVELIRDATYEREVDQLKTSLVSTVSHELRTPLTMISGFAELLQSHRLDSAKAEEAVHRIHSSAVRLARLIDDLLSVARIESGRMEIRIAPVPVGEVARAAVEGFAGERQIDLRLDDALPDVLADRDRLVQILTNLLSNGVKYSPPGTPVHLDIRRDDVGVAFSVTDHGIGMSQEEQEQLFAKFFRAPRPEVRKAVGTGLGLYITKHLIEMHGSALRVDSALGHGSTFAFSLPATPLPDPRGRPWAAHSPAWGSEPGRGRVRPPAGASGRLTTLGSVREPAAAEPVRLEVREVHDVPIASTVESPPTCRDCGRASRGGETRRPTGTQASDGPTRPGTEPSRHTGLGPVPDVDDRIRLGGDRGPPVTASSGKDLVGQSQRIVATSFCQAPPGCSGPAHVASRSRGGPQATGYPVVAPTLLHAPAPRPSRSLGPASHPSDGPEMQAEGPAQLGSLDPVNRQGESSPFAQGWGKRP